MRLTGKLDQKAEGQGAEGRPAAGVVADARCCGLPVLCLL